MLRHQVQTPMRAFFLLKVGGEAFFVCFSFNYYPSPTRSVCEDTLVCVCVLVST